MILTVMKDIGGMEALLPVIAKLRESHDVQIVASGVSRERLRDRNIAFFDALNVRQVLTHFGTPALLLVSMCTGRWPGRDLIPLVKGRCPSIVVQDQWGVLAEWRSQAYCPDRIIVNDIIGKSLVENVWTISPSHIEIIGYSALDMLANLRRASGMPLGRAKRIFYGGQLQSTGLALQELACALNALPNSAHYELIIGTHPRFRTDDPALADDVARINIAKRSFQGTATELPSTTLVSDTIRAIAASDVTTSMSSTTLTYAAALQKPAISIMYPDTPMWAQYLQGHAGHIEEFPPTKLGCVMAPRNRQMLTEYLRTALTKGVSPSMARAQRVHLVADGKNAERVAAFIRSLL